jgi:hypothetical protein
MSIGERATKMHPLLIGFDDQARRELSFNVNAPSVRCNDCRWTTFVRYELVMQNHHCA